MPARLIVRRRRVFADGDVAEFFVWQLATPVVGSVHPFKYRFAYVSGRTRIIGSDNERGKGDHQHIAGDEVPYHFQGVDRLLSDFAASVRAWRSAHGKAP